MLVINIVYTDADKEVHIPKTFIGIPGMEDETWSDARKAFFSLATEGEDDDCVSPEEAAAAWDTDKVVYLPYGLGKFEVVTNEPIVVAPTKSLWLEYHETYKIVYTNLNGEKLSQYRQEQLHELVEDDEYLIHLDGGSGHLEDRTTGEVAYYIQGHLHASGYRTTL